jgi:FtsZ-binding cell division protein ZapB
LTTELERIKILEGKISQVVEYVNKLAGENEKLKGLVKELKADKAKSEEQAKRAVRLDDELKKYEADREAVKNKIEALIGQIDQLGL